MPLSKNAGSVPAVLLWLTAAFSLRAAQIRLNLASAQASLHQTEVGLIDIAVVIKIFRAASRGRTTDLRRECSTGGPLSRCLKSDGEGARVAQQSPFCEGLTSRHRKAPLDPESIPVRV